MNVNVMHPGQPGAAFLIETETCGCAHRMTLSEARSLHRLLGEAIRQHRAGIMNWRKDSGLCGEETDYGYCTSAAGHPGPHNYDGRYH